MALQLTLTDSEARLRSFTGDKYAGGNYGTLVRFWTNIDATVAKTLINGINVLTPVSNPIADGKTYTGTFYGLKPVAEGETDRSVTIVQTLVNVRTWSVASGAADEIVNYNEGTRFHRQIRSWFKIRSTDQATALAALAQGGAQGNVTNYQVTSVSVQDNDDGSISLAQTLQYAEIWTSVPSPHQTDPFKVLVVAGEETVLGNDYTFFSYKTASGAVATARAALQGAYAETNYDVSINTVDHRNGIFDITVRKVFIEQAVTVPDYTIGRIATWTRSHYIDYQNKAGNVYRKTDTYEIEYYAHATPSAAISYITLHAGTGDETPFGQSDVFDTWHGYKNVSKVIKQIELNEPEPLFTWPP